MSEGAGSYVKRALRWAGRRNWWAFCFQRLAGAQRGEPVSVQHDTKALDSALAKLRANTGEFKPRLLRDEAAALLAERRQMVLLLASGLSDGEGWLPDDEARAKAIVDANIVWANQ
jgi:hypothetical protein